MNPLPTLITSIIDLSTTKKNAHLPHTPARLGLVETRKRTNPPFFVVVSPMERKSRITSG
jgi:hypothetical protein